MADRDPFISRRLADCRIETLFAVSGRVRVGRAPGGWRRAVGRTLAQVGEALPGERREAAPSLRPAGLAR
jgi:hypothetical protein